MREINENHIRISADFITEGTKIGDLDWQMLLQDNQTREKKYMNFRAEVKFRVEERTTDINIQSKLCSECLEFFLTNVLALFQVITAYFSAMNLWNIG